MAKAVNTRAPKARVASGATPKTLEKVQAEIGIIGGSGLYAMPGLEAAREVRMKTPFGDPSDALVVGNIEGHRVAFLARHGRGHRFMPSEIAARTYCFVSSGFQWDRTLAAGLTWTSQCSWVKLGTALYLRFF